MDSLKAGVILHGKSYDYNIVKTLGQGTFGITYLASVKMKGALGSLDSELLVAVKEFFMRDFNGRNENSVTYSSKDGAFAYYKSKFINEANNLSNLQNQGIIKVIELFEENQTAYYVMEYVSNGSLDELIKVKGRLSSEDCVSFSLQIAKALSYMHENKMLHLDLKPNNIMVRKDNQLVLIDFGLSKRFDAYGKPETSTTIGHGTPGYAPVEQANYQGSDNGEFPATMDIYALGGTMFKMLTGHRPPEASVILNEGFPISELENIGVAKQLSDIVACCMEPRRKNRYKTTVEVIDVLSKLDIFSQEEETEIQNGHYKRKSGEREYGTFKIDKIPVTSAFEFPQYINIKLWDNSQKGKSYEVIMTDGHFEDDYYSLIGYHSLMRIWDMGVLVYEHEFQYGIPDDVKEFVKSHGFLSTEHWEIECDTSPIDDDFGTDAFITMIQRNGDKFERRVAHAHKSYHNLLLNELNDLLYTTSLNKEIIKGEQSLRNTKPISEPTLSPVPLRDDTNKIIITHTFQTPIIDGYELEITPKKIRIKATNGHAVFGESSSNEIELECDVFPQILTEIRSWDYMKKGNVFNRIEYSESPDQISVILYNCQATPYLILECQSIGGRSFGNLHGNSCELSNRISSLIPDFDKLLKLSQDKQKNSDFSEDDSSEKSKKVSWSDVVFQNIVMSFIVGLISLPTYFFTKSSDDLFLWLWLTLAVMELNGGILFGLGQRISNKLENISFGIALLCVLAYIVLWIIQMIKWWV